MQVNKDFMYISDSAMQTQQIVELNKQRAALKQQIGDLCQQVNTLTKQRDALLDALRGFDDANSEWRKGFYQSELVRLVDETKDVVTVEDVVKTIKIEFVVQVKMHAGWTEKFRSIHQEWSEDAAKYQATAGWPVRLLKETTHEEVISELNSMTKAETVAL